ncbi:hypothetical protein Vadar_003889 [Vaccinium darrowii]|uniref:Uncharacterized protein n=1 Tax=Vaccinium darrowii TaxID=229202 RepID=A0ACB7WXE0_9ERIC|nr:hypothetical protein Vadar_003889 [Vaccinium darrowii]
MAGRRRRGNGQSVKNRLKSSQEDRRRLEIGEVCRGRSLARSGCKRKRNLRRQDVGRRKRHSATSTSSASSASSRVRMLEIGDVQHAEVNVDDTSNCGTLYSDDNFGEISLDSKIMINRDSEDLDIAALREGFQRVIWSNDTDEDNVMGNQRGFTPPPGVSREDLSRVSWTYSIARAAESLNISLNQERVSEDVVPKLHKKYGKAALFALKLDIKVYQWHQSPRFLAVGTMVENTRSQEMKRMDDAIRRNAETTQQQLEILEEIKNSIAGLTQLITTLNSKYEGGIQPSWVGLGAAVWLQIASGSAYKFPLYSNSLKSFLGFSQQQLMMLGVANDSEFYGLLFAVPLSPCLIG